MTELDAPLRKHLEDGYDESDVQRTWRGVQRRLVSREEERRTRGRGVWMFGLGSATTAAMAGALWLSVVSSSPAGPLKLTEDGSPLELGSALETRGPNVVLSDGSRIVLKSGSHLDVLENRGGVFMTALRRGKGTFDVTPGGPRRWVIDCGLATVEVVGTGFTIERTDDAVDVEVAHGVVMVRGERVPSGARRLTAGERIEVRGETRTVQRTEAPPPPTVAAEPAAVASASGAPVADTTTPSVRFTPAANTAGELPMVPVASSSATDTANAGPIGALLRDADGARQSGDRRRGAEIMQRLVKEGRNDPRASFAAFALARWIIESDPQQAADTLTAMLDAGVPLGLEEDARARQVEAWSRAGNRERAERHAAEYEKQFPDGSRLSEVRAWASAH